MTKEQAVIFLRSAGFSKEQIKMLVKALELSKSLETDKHIIKSTKYEFCPICGCRLD